MKNYLVLLVMCLLSTVSLLAQNGTLRGTIYDEFGGPAMYANVEVLETGEGTSSDLDGKYELTLAPGNYTLLVSYVGYDDRKIPVLINAGQVTLIDVNLTTGGVQLEDEVIIIGKQITNTDQAMNTLKSKAAVALDGLSNQSLRMFGASRASDAVKQVTGVSVQGGKYVFVRGLGDRYTKTILNGMDIPGLDPDRNTIQMDIFPSNVIENIVVYKAFSPDLPGDFTGGIVNIDTKEFPEQKILDISIGIGFTPGMTFNSEYVRGNDGVGSDALGFDNGARDMPLTGDLAQYREITPDPFGANAADVGAVTRSFNNNLGVETGTAPMNFNFSLSAGNQFKANEDADWTFGYNVALGYRNTTQYFQDVEYNAFFMDDLSENYALRANRIQQGTLGKNNVLASALGGFSAKNANHKLSFNVLHIQNGEATAGDFISETIINNSVTLYRDNIEYTQRGITNFLLKYKGSFNEGRSEIEVRVSPTISNIYDKDVRVTPFRFNEDNNTFDIQASEGAVPDRFWRNLEETNQVAKIDFTQKFKLGNAGQPTSKFKAGFIATRKDRFYEILGYRGRIRGNQSNMPVSYFENGDQDLIFTDANVWDEGDAVGTYIFGNYEAANTYEATQDILGAYVMGDLIITPKLRAIIGARLETFRTNYSSGIDPATNTRLVENERYIDATNILPAVNLVYTLKENMNLRVSLSQTVARPSFKEASVAEIIDAVSGRTYIGGFVGDRSLVSTTINNFDIRWEQFLEKGQLLAFSVFYKQFNNPIEIVAFDRADPNDLQPRNVGDATVFGIEAEAKKNLKFIAENLEKVNVGANLTLVSAQVEQDPITLASKEANKRDGETISDTRPMQGQSPYIINAYVNYSDRLSGWEASLNYNVQGRSLYVVGLELNPDVYQVPFNGLNLKVTKTFGVRLVDGQYEGGNFSLSFRATNLLDAARKRVYVTYDPADNNSFDETFDVLRPGRTFSITAKYRFF